MSKVRFLPEALINLIAAGEVVERPASVVKELLENALDAGAGRIAVRLLAGGTELVQVSDDGSGMSQEDALMAIERHATSKLSRAEDLGAVATLGFRGEALPSIAAVGRFTLETWDGKEAAGTRLVMEGGRLLTVEACGRARGTTVRLGRIFGGVPARRKFLRSPDTEKAHCLRAVEEEALAHPGTAFEVEDEGGSLLSLPPVDDWAERAFALWGADLARSLRSFHEVRGEGAGGGGTPGETHGARLRLRGLISPPEITFSRRSRHHVQVNGRPVRDGTLNRLIGEALGGLYPADRFPALALALDLPPGEVDVNVHPAKREVRLRKPRDLVEALRSALSRPAAVPWGGASARTGLPLPGPGGDSLSPGWPGPSPGSPGPVGPPSPGEGPALPEAGLFTPAEEGSGAGRARYIGQFHSTYLLAEEDGRLLLVDQHAAHERIVYNRLLAGHASGRPPSQALLVPETLELGAAQGQNLRAKKGLLEAFGFVLEEFGPRTLKAAALPAALPPVSAGTLLRELAADLEDTPDLPMEIALAISRRACRKAVKAGDPLTPREGETLLGELRKAEAGFACPHGRPTRAVLGTAELEKLFKRR